MVLRHQMHLRSVARRFIPPSVSSTMLGQLFLTIAILALFHCKNKRQFSCHMRYLSTIFHTQRPSQRMNVCALQAPKYAHYCRLVLISTIQIFRTGRLWENPRSLFLPLYVLVLFSISGIIYASFPSIARSSSSLS